MSPSRTPPGTERGLIIAIGGAEDKKKDRSLLKYFVKAARGTEGRILVFPTASEQDGTGEVYARLFNALEVEETQVVHLDNREAALAQEDQVVEALDSTTGVFFVGGNQMRLTTVLGGTTILQALRKRHAEGLIVAGTSAGAALLSEHMIAFGDSGLTPAVGRVTLCPGMGLTNKVIFDQHFTQRDRFGRLATALTYNPFPIGVGIDEDTAAIIDAHDVLHIIGKNAVTLIDARQCPWTNSAQLVGPSPISIFGLSVHILTAGCTFDIHTRTPFAPKIFHQTA